MHHWQGGANWHLAGIAAVAVFLSGCVGFGYPRSLGVRKSARDLSNLKNSPQWEDKEEVFENPEPMWTDVSLRSVIRAYRGQSKDASPKDPEKELRQYELAVDELYTSPETGLRVTWFGHSSIYLELDNKRVLIDPVWEASSPVQWLGPQRWIAPSIELDQLPEPDVVVISHDHYDHLDYRSIQKIKHWGSVFVAPLGVGQHLALWGIEPKQIVELDWWQEHSLGDVSVVATPSRHASGRGIFDQNATLWAGWAFLGPKHRVYYSGDTGLFDGLKEIGRRLGPFDLSMIEVGQYNPNWPDWHLGPEQAVLAHQWVRAEALLPVHWGAYKLAMHSWTAPIERTLSAAKMARVKVITPRLCEPTEPSVDDTAPWWTPDVPYKNADEEPIIANDANGRPARTEK